MKQRTVKDDGLLQEIETKINDLCTRYQDNYKKGRDYLAKLDNSGVMREPRKHLAPNAFETLCWKLSETINSTNPYNNTGLVKDILKARLEYAGKEGSQTFASYVFAQPETLFDTVEQVNKFLLSLMNKSYKELDSERKNIQIEYPDYRTLSVIPTEERNKYYGKKYGKHQKTFSFLTVLTSTVLLVNKIFGIDFIQNTPELWTLVSGKKSVKLRINLFDYTNVIPGSHYAHCHESKEDGQIVYTIDASSKDRTGETLEFEEIRFFLIALGRVVSGLLSQDNDTNILPVELKQSCGRFLGEFTHDINFLRSLGLSEEVARITSEECIISLSTEYFIEALKSYIDVNVHNISNMEDYEDIKKLENKIIREIHTCLSDETVFPEYLDHDVISLTNMTNVFHKTKGSMSYMPLIAVKAGEYLYQKYASNHSFNNEIRGLYENPDASNLFRKLTSIDFYTE